MLKFRALPGLADSTSGKPPPTTWPPPFPPHTFFSSARDVETAVTADWAPWWADVKPSYQTVLEKRHIGIRGIAHALHLEFTNGWSFDFCLRFCEENLINTPQGITALPTVAMLTTRGRALVDEMIGSAVAIALAGNDG